MLLWIYVYSVLHSYSGSDANWFGFQFKISKPVLWQYETKKSIPSAEVIKKIAIFFNVTTDFLIFDDFDKRDVYLKNINIEFIEKLDIIFQTNKEYKYYIETIKNLLYDKNK